MNYKPYPLYFVLGLFVCLIIPSKTLANYYCTNLTEANASQVLSDIQLFYENNLGGTNTISVMAEVNAMFQSFDLPSTDNLSCDRGELFITGSESWIDFPNRGFTKLNFRWQDSSSDCIDFYGGYLDLFTLANGASTIPSPGASFNVQESPRGKLLAMNARCADAQSAYFIIIIDRDLDLTSLPKPGEQGVSGGNNISQLRWQEDDILETSLEVCPNPIQDTPAKVEFQLEQEQFSSIYIVEGSTGKLIQTVLARQKLQQGRHHAFLDLHAFPPGVYYAILETDRKRLVKKLVKCSLH